MYLVLVFGQMYQHNKPEEALVHVFIETEMSLNECESNVALKNTKL